MFENVPLILGAISRFLYGDHLDLFECFALFCILWFVAEVSGITYLSYKRRKARINPDKYEEILQASKAFMFSNDPRESRKGYKQKR
jgi:hypothetical protein